MSEEGIEGIQETAGSPEAADAATAVIDEPAPESGEVGEPAPEGSPLADRELGDGVASPRGVAAGDMSARALGLLADVSVELSVELGRSRIPMRDLMALEPGSVFELDRPTEAPVDVLVNGTIIARGEVVVVDGDFGVRITEITGGE